MCGLNLRAFWNAIIRPFLRLFRPMCLTSLEIDPNLISKGADVEFCLDFSRCNFATLSKASEDEKMFLCPAADADETQYKLFGKLHLLSVVVGAKMVTSSPLKPALSFSSDVIVSARRSNPSMNELWQNNEVTFPKS